MFIRIINQRLLMIPWTLVNFKDKLVSRFYLRILGEISAWQQYFLKTIFFFMNYFSFLSFANHTILQNIDFQGAITSLGKKMTWKYLIKRKESFKFVARKPRKRKQIQLHDKVYVCSIQVSCSDSRYSINFKIRKNS